MKVWLLAFCASHLLRLLRLTYRYELKFPNAETENLYKEFMQFKNPCPDHNFLLAFFHQDELCLVPFYKHTGFSVLVSVSKDGEIMSQTSQKLGYYPVRGSSSKKAVAGLIAAIKKVKAGYKFAFAVDGPRGPIYKVKEGICAVAKKTQRPILPVRCHVKNSYIFKNSWNKAKFPKPFTKIILNFGSFKIYNSSELEETLTKL